MADLLKCFAECAALHLRPLVRARGDDGGFWRCLTPPITKQLAFRWWLVLLFVVVAVWFSPDGHDPFPPLVTVLQVGLYGWFGFNALGTTLMWHLEARRELRAGSCDA